MAQTQTTTQNPYTELDAGCYVDGHFGIYVTDNVMAMAEAHGMEAPEPCECEGHYIHDNGEWSYSYCEFVGDFEDEADEYMNSTFPVDGHYWGRSEQGDWGLWTNEDEDAS